MKAALLLVSLALGAPAPPDREHLPVRAEVVVDDGRIEETGLFEVSITFSVEQDVLEPRFVRLVVGLGTREILRRDHIPDPPLARWRKGDVVRYELPCAFPSDLDLPAVPRAELRLGFVRPGDGDVLAPLGTEPYSSGLARVGQVRIPRYAAIDDREDLERRIDLARSLAREDPISAWNVLEVALRCAAEPSWKLELRDELLEIGRAASVDPPSLGERRIVERRIADERARFLRLVAGRMFDRGRLHGALALLREVGGELAERADEAVIGALDQAQRAMRRTEDVERAILERIEPEQEELALALERRHGPTRKLLDAALGLARRGRAAEARFLLRRLRLADDPRLREEARRFLPEVERELLEQAPEEELEEARAAIEHPAFARIAVRASREAIWIGPKRLVESIPDESLLAFDLAYLYVTDLFGRVPNPEGDRITVFFKELWDFGGGVGGGTTIDIGRADPNARGMRVDTALLFHELTHCVDDTRPVLGGMREGLANVGAVYALWALGRREEAKAAFRDNLERFHRDYLARDLEYWRIPNYGPSAGLFLHFVDRASKGAAWDFSPLARFFRTLRSLEVPDAREAGAARTLALALSRAFGPWALEDLRRFRWPLADLDPNALEAELAGSGAGVSEDAIAVRDELQRELLEKASEDPDGALAFARDRLGTIVDWRVVGTFAASKGRSGPVVQPPEIAIDFAATWPVRNSVARWVAPADRPPVRLLPIGWIALDFPYQDHTSSFAVSSFSVPKDLDALLWLRADDRVTAWIDGVRVGHYEGGRRAGTVVPWRGPWVEMPDAISFPVFLAEGRHVLLLEIENDTGPAGFSCALSDTGGAAIGGLDVDAEAADGTRFARRPAPRKWRRRFRSSLRGRNGGLDVAAGGFRQARKALRGTSTERGVAWRKYTVRPGFPKDSPSNLGWLPERATEGLGDFRLDVGLRLSGPPKIGVVFQGDGSKDALSGWTLLVIPAGGGGVRARLERYDRLVLRTEDLAPVQPLGADEERVLRIEYRDETVTAALGSLTLFDGVPIRPIRGIGPDGTPGGAPPPSRIGLFTWGDEPGLTVVELWEPSRSAPRDGRKPRERRQ